MWYILIIGFLLIGVFFSTKLRCQNPTINSDNIRTTSTIKPLNPNDTIKGMFSKKQIDEKLKRLAKTPAPTNLAYGAKCYKMAIADASVYEYYCPVCGEKTVYKKGKLPKNIFYIDDLEEKISSCRREIEKVKGENIKLDESQFCKHCSPKTENPELCLLVNIAGQSDTTKVCNIRDIDIKIIGEFLNDKLVLTGNRDEETPLINDIDRIKKLLGVK
jgi:hypothetical protein